MYKYYIDKRSGFKYMFKVEDIDTVDTKPLVEITEDEYKDASV